uniref:Myb-like domain-containing protein n=1 Tax=Brassica oleracea var. oleracea TaxID=109376 RepID=A0A0D3BA62_BRAOL
MISRGPWLLLDDSIGEISSRQSSGVCLGGIAVSVSLLDNSESLSVPSTTPPLSYSPRRRRDSVTLSLSSPARRSPRGNQISRDQISSDEVLSWVMLSLLDACSLPMSSVNLYAFDDERIKRDVKVSLYGRFKSHEACSKESTTTTIQTSNFVDLLNSQQDVVFGLGEDSVRVSSSQVPHFGEIPVERKERRTWTPTDDQVLISSWLNTSKDPVVGNEQRSGAFWQRIAAYFAASPKIAVSERREAGHCKQRWHKINDLVGKFCGAFEAASRERTSGQNDNDVLKLAHEIFFNNHNKKFTLEHAWKELRNDQKWCDLSTSTCSRVCLVVVTGVCFYV